MINDPIVKEVRKAGEKLAKKSDYNVHIFFEKLRKNESLRNFKIVKQKMIKGKNNIISNVSQGM